MVLIIVILGVLAATAAPKFIDLSSDAKKANMKALAGAMASAADLIFYKSKISGYLSEDVKKLTISYGIVEVKNGYPEVRADTSGRLDILTRIEINDDWLICYSNNCELSGNSSTIKIGYNPTEDNTPEACYVRYTEPKGTNNPSDDKYMIKIYTDGC